MPITTNNRAATLSPVHLVRGLLLPHATVAPRPSPAPVRRGRKT